jgi:hypothetical protein
MPNEMVMRSVYLRPEEDAALRQLAFDIEVTKSDLIRSAISAKLDEWLQSNSLELLLKDVELGKRPSRADRAEAARAEAEAAESARRAVPPSSTRAAAGQAKPARRDKPIAPKRKAAAPDKPPARSRTARSSEHEPQTTRESALA